MSSLAVALSVAPCRLPSMSRALSRNAPCPCGSGRKFKRCCQEALDNPVLLARRHNAVGSRVRSWGLKHYGEQVSAAFQEIAGGRERLVLGDADVQLIETWALSDRELPGGGTIARRYALSEDISETERDIAKRIAAASLALLRVDGVTPGRWITMYDLTQGESADVSSHDVSLKVKPGYVLAGRLMNGPPAQTLWGPVAILDRGSGGELSGLLHARLRTLELEQKPDGLAIALQAASREITAALVPGIRRAGSARLAA
jgi:hypothetical protein